jgi:hypothetical protein
MLYCMLTFLTSSNFGMDLAILMWTKNDALYHEVALFRIVAFGLLAIVWLGSTYSRLFEVTYAVEPPYLDATRRRIRWIAALIFVVVVACFGFGSAAVYSKRFGLFYPKLPVLLGMIAILGIFLSWRKIKRLTSDFATPPADSPSQRS